MFILAGAAASWCSRGRGATIVIGMLVAAFAVESARAYPHYLAYFNPLVSREEAYRHLVDSNLDWGQDLPGLKRWLESPEAAVGDRPVYLSYFGTGSPDYYEINAMRLPIRDPQLGVYPLKGGIYCISATDLQAVYLPIGGRWNESYERVYQALVRRLTRPNDQPSPPSAEEQQLDSLVETFPDLRHARLMAFLRQREPDHQIGYSILIYRLSDADVLAATQGPPVELDAQSWGQLEALRRKQ
jgi:hypothetical protein